MTLQDFLRVLRERWLIILAFVGLAAIAGGIFWYLQPKQYTSNLALYVSAQSADSTTAAYHGAQLSKQRVTSYLSLIESDRVMGEVIADLGLPMTAEALAKQVTVSSKANSVLIDVAVTDESPQGAADIANSVGRVFPNLVSELERPTASNGVPPVVVRVVQPAAAPDAPSSASLSAILALGVLVGLSLGVGAAIARSALDRSIKSAAQLEDVAGVANLGMVAVDPNMEKRPLIVLDDPRWAMEEAFLQLRTNLQFVDMDHPRNAVTVTSALPAIRLDDHAREPGRSTGVRRYSGGRGRSRPEAAETRRHAGAGSHSWAHRRPRRSHPPHGGDPALYGGLRPSRQCAAVEPERAAGVPAEGRAPSRTAASV